MKTSAGGFVAGVIALILIAVALERGGLDLDLVSMLLLSIGLGLFVESRDH